MIAIMNCPRSSWNTLLHCFNLSYLRFKFIFSSPRHDIRLSADVKYIHGKYKYRPFNTTQDQLKIIKTLDCVLVKE